MPESDRTPSAFWQVVRANHKLQHQTPVIKPAPRNQNIPLTFGQERLWWIDQIQPDTTAHNLRSIVRLEGQLDQGALEQSLRTIVRRHEILRTRFPAVAGHPVQVIEPDLALELPVIDLTNLPQPRQEAEVQRLAAAEAQAPFDLAHGPLIRLKLLRLAEDVTILIRTIHHIINDRWSDSVFMGELAELYTAFSQGKPAQLPDLPIQYADVALFQREWFQGDVLVTQLDYWRQQLGGQLSPLELPIASRSPGERYQGSAEYVTLPAELVTSLKRLAHESGVSLFVVLLAAFKTLLYQYSGQQDLCLCVPVAGRNRVETRKLLGYFNNLVLVRTLFAETQSFRDLITQVSQVTVGVFEHQALPLQQIADALNIPGAMLTRAMFTLQNVPSFPTAMGGVTITPLDMPEGISNFDLSLSMKMQNEHLLGVLRYKTDLFQMATITQLLERFHALLQDLVVNPAVRLADLPRFSVEKPPIEGDKPAETEAVYVAPQSELEHTIAAIWQTVLRLERISIDANFFDLGGRSLDLVQVGSKLQAAFQQEIPLRELFKQPTIRLLAHYVRQKRDANPGFARNMQHRTQNQLEALKRQKEQMQRRRKSDG